MHVAVAHGLSNAKKVLDAVKAGEKNYDFVEVMACSGGCIGGGGQPRSKVGSAGGTVFGGEARSWTVSLPAGVLRQGMGTAGRLGNCSWG